MKKTALIILIVIIVLCIVFFIIFYNKNAVLHSMPDDFNFSLTFGVDGKNIINTYENTFTKDVATVDDIETIEFNISESKMQEIYQCIKEYKIDKWPSELYNKGVVSSPSQQLNFIYTDNGETKSIVWKDAIVMEHRKTSKQNNRFLRLVNTITEYIYNTDEYKNMSPQDLYM